MEKKDFAGEPILKDCLLVVIHLNEREVQLWEWFDNSYLKKICGRQGIRNERFRAFAQNFANYRTCVGTKPIDDLRWIYSLHSHEHSLLQCLESIPFGLKSKI